MEIVLSLLRAAQLVAAMEKDGWHVSWDAKIGGGGALAPASPGDGALEDDCVVLHLDHNGGRGRVATIRRAGTSTRRSSRKVPGAQSTMSVTFRRQQPDDSGRRGEVTVCNRRDGSILVGRAPGADLQTRHMGVSRRHAEIAFLGKSRIPVLTDLDSRNGTTINGRKVKRAVLHVDDVICFSSLEMVVERIE